MPLDKLNDLAKLGEQRTKLNTAIDEINSITDGTTSGDIPVTATGTTTPRTLGDWTEKEILSYNSIADAKADAKLDVGRRVKTYGYYAVGDGGGASYTVVSGGTGTDDGGSFHDVANGTQLQLVPDSNRIINLRQFGATGSKTGDDTTAIDNWLLYTANLKPIFTDQINNSRSILGASDAPVLYVPSGIYNYSGTGFEPIPFNSVFQFKGDGPDTSTIRILTDTHLIRETDTTDTIRFFSSNDMAFQGGRGLFFSTKMNVTAVQYGFSFHKTKFYGYTSCAIGSLRLNAARWWVSECTFSGGNIGTPVGILFPPEAGMIDLHGCIFSDNKYHLICGEQSIGRFTQSRIGPHNSFFDAGISDRVADILLIPSPTDFTNGKGVEIAGNRFSNENADKEDYCILIADIDETKQALGEFDHLTTLSTGTFRSMRVVNNNIARLGRVVPEDSKGVVYSYAYKTGGMMIADNEVSSMPWFLEFDPVVTNELIDSGKNHLNRFLPLKSGPAFAEPSPKRGCNRNGGGLLINNDGGYYGTGRGLDYSNFGDVGIIKLLPNNNPDSGLVGTGTSKSLVTDVDGGALAIELTYTDENSGPYVLTAGTIRANLVAGMPAFVEFDIKSGSSDSLKSIYVDFIVESAVTREIVIVNDNWQRVKFPISWAGDYTTGTFEIRLVCDNNYKVGENKVQVGRRSFYQSQGQVPYSIQAI